jgi:hypothetical protein
MHKVWASIQLSEKHLGKETLDFFGKTWKVPEVCGSPFILAEHLGKRVALVNGQLVLM